MRALAPTIQSGLWASEGLTYGRRSPRTNFFSDIEVRLTWDISTVRVMYSDKQRKNINTLGEWHTLNALGELKTPTPVMLAGGSVNFGPSAEPLIHKVHTSTVPYQIDESDSSKLEDEYIRTYSDATSLINDAREKAKPVLDRLKSYLNE